MENNDNPLGLQKKYMISKYFILNLWINFMQITTEINCAMVTELITWEDAVIKIFIGPKFMGDIFQKQFSKLI